MEKNGYKQSKHTPCIFIKKDDHTGKPSVVNMLWVDDILTSANAKEDLDVFENQLNKQFKVTRKNEENLEYLKIVNLRSTSCHTIPSSCHIIPCYTH
jgi:hypothetical protein